MRSIAAPICAVSMLVAGCGATIHSSVAPSADLAKYKTYSFYTPTDGQVQPESIADGVIKSALKRDLAKAGFTEAMAGQPDFLIAFKVKQQQKLDVHTGGYGYGYYGYGHRFGTWPGATNVTEYTQGTLVIDFIDRQTQQVFWRGTGSQVVNHPDSPNLDKIDKVVGQIVDKYPTSMASVSRNAM